MAILNFDSNSSSKWMPWFSKQDADIGPAFSCANCVFNPSFCGRIVPEEFLGSDVFHFDVCSRLTAAVRPVWRGDIRRVPEMASNRFASPNSHLPVTAWTPNNRRITDLKWKNRPVVLQSDEWHRSILKLFKRCSEETARSRPV
ncbi:hypothetical protein [Haloarcula sp. DT43]